MTQRYADIAFTDGVKDVQRARGTREAYARRDARVTAEPSLSPAERRFIEARDSFYVASVSETGWPYVQFRGGPAGFLRVTGPAEIGFPDFDGNGQFITTGNVAADDRVALFLMDYPARRRLKLFGRMRVVERDADPDLVDRFAVPGDPAPLERAFVIAVEAFDWNCPRYITPRYTLDDILGNEALHDAIRAGATARDPLAD